MAGAIWRIKMKNNSQFKTMRHIEAVRNYLIACIKELMLRGMQHDQSKLFEPELSLYNEYTPKLRELTYGSEQYRECLSAIEPAVKHYYSVNRHHPEHFPNKLRDMNLIDVLEMLCDWKAATHRHESGDIYKSLEINAKRFDYSQEIYLLLKNTIDWLETQNVKHHAEES